jgi:hypothetical protein
MKTFIKADINIEHIFRLPENLHIDHFRLDLCIRYKYGRIATLVVSIKSSDNNYKLKDLTYSDQDGFDCLDMGYVLDLSNGLLHYPQVMSSRFCKEHKSMNMRIIPPEGASAFYVIKSGICGIEIKWIPKIAKHYSPDNG